MTHATIKASQVIHGFVVQDVFAEGRGGMARVVRATPQTKRPGGPDDVALKISRNATDAYYEQALRAETEVLRRFSHPGVVKILPIPTSAGRTTYMARATELDGTPWFFVMEFLAGGSLDAYIKALGKLEIPEAAHIAAKVGHALDHVHHQNYAHNDLKPENVLFRRELKPGEKFDPVLIDFGIAAKLSRTQADAMTLRFTSPERLEQVQGATAPEVANDPSKADIWALSILFYRMLAGKLPFDGISDKTITTAIRTQHPNPLRNINPAVPAEIDEYIINKCLNKLPRFRPTAREFADFMDQYGARAVVSKAAKKRRLFG